MPVTPKQRGIRDSYLLPARSGWVSFYERRSSDQDDVRIRDIASGISRDTKAPVIAFLVHDSDIACYWLYDDGAAVDEFNSFPDYFESSDLQSGPHGGRPEILFRYCRPGITPRQLASILAQESLFAEQLVEQLAEALGIDVERALSDYRDVAEDGGPDAFGGSDGGDGGDGGDDHRSTGGRGGAGGVSQFRSEGRNGWPADDDEPRILPMFR